MSDQRANLKPDPNAIKESHPRRRWSRRRLIGFGITGAGVLVTGAIIPDLYSRVVDGVVEGPNEPQIQEFPADLGIEKNIGSCLVMGTPDRVQGPPPDTNSSAFGPDMEAWVQKNQGTDADASFVQFAVTSPRSAIVITNVRIVVVERTKPLAGLLVQTDGGGDFIHNTIQVDLDSEQVDSTKYGPQGESWDFPISIGPNDTMALTIAARTQKSSVKWLVEVDFVADGSKQTKQILDKSNKPFVTNASISATHHWDWTSLIWAPGRA